MTQREANDHLHGYEPYEQRMRPIVLPAVLLAAATLAILASMKLAHDRLEREVSSGASAPGSLAGERAQPPEPRLQDQPALDLEHLRAREHAKLSTYGWIDREAGLVSVPIERAMELVVEEGLPARTEKER